MNEYRWLWDGVTAGDPEPEVGDIAYRYTIALAFYVSFIVTYLIAWR
jgi:hypothetical protein